MQRPDDINDRIRICLGIDFVGLAGTMSGPSSRPAPDSGYGGGSNSWTVRLGHFGVMMTVRDMQAPMPVYNQSVCLCVRRVTFKFHCNQGSLESLEIFCTAVLHLLRIHFKFRAICNAVYKRESSFRNDLR